MHEHSNGPWEAYIFLKGRTNVHDEPCSGTPSATNENPALIDANKLIVLEDRCVTLDKILACCQFSDKSSINGDDCQ